jgi:hypothetical protein
MFKAKFSMKYLRTLLKGTNKGAGPSGRDVISLRKEDSLMVFEYDGS